MLIKWDLGTLECDIKRLEFPQGEYKRYLDGSCYELDPENDILTITSEGKTPLHIDEEAAARVIEKVGEKKARIYGDVLGFLSLILLLFLVTALLLITNWAAGKDCAYFILNYIGFSGNVLWYSILAILAITAALLFFGSLGSKYTNAVNYYLSTKCKSCSRNFAFKEFKKPLFKEISTLDRYEITMTRYWKCKFCGIESCRIDSLDYNNHKGKRNDQKEDFCRICFSKSAMREYRDPDVKEELNLETTVRHYKCSNCGFREITVERVVLKNVEKCLEIQ